MSIIIITITNIYNRIYEVTHRFKEEKIELTSGRIEEYGRLR